MSDQHGTHVPEGYQAAPHPHTAADPCPPTDPNADTPPTTAQSPYNEPDYRALAAEGESVLE